MGSRGNRRLSKDLAPEVKETFASFMQPEDLTQLMAITLGGTGKEVGDHHPKIGQVALTGVAANILGNITIREGAMVAAGSLVLKDMPPHTDISPSREESLNPSKARAPLQGVAFRKFLKARYNKAKNTMQKLEV
ncbi:hypothetical protein H6P81_007060 [Aristolochia fimbriata]|uniref:Uncharacterized protein n=1 Tax=Aristolochia fimbriata TaxID=158543 RepID=A0AAV7F2T1_ARIFI|nr:hypothetical protein H6P81_007060 [Aristolochia fimbriata]